jgi:copper chaperone
MKVETLNIEGMHCGHCTDLIKNSLSIVKGISETDVSLGKVTITYDEDVASREVIEDAITRFGYKIRDY